MRYWTSDQHFYHANVIGFCDRPYKTVEEMNEKLIYNWNQIVGSEDTVYVLGDFSLAFRPVEIFSHRLMGQKILIPGNHDFCHSYNKKSRNPINKEKWEEKYREHGWVVGKLIEKIEISGLEVSMSHMPHNCQDERYKKYIPKNDAAWQLHGHTHSKKRVDGNLIHVGVDAWDYKPVSESQIIDIIEKG